MNDEFDIDAPEQFSVGTFGEVGNRTFLLHVVQRDLDITLKVEKRQVAVLAEYLARLIKELGRPGHLPEDLDFDTTVEPEWIVGTIGISFESSLDRLVVVIEAAGDDDAAVLRVALTREQAGAFAIRATSLVESGRPPCPLCGYPLDPNGHDCPRTNGNRPPLT